MRNIAYLKVNLNYVNIMRFFGSSNLYIDEFSRGFLSVHPTLHVRRGALEIEEGTEFEDHRCRICDHLVQFDNLCGNIQTSHQLAAKTQTESISVDSHYSQGSPFNYALLYNHLIFPGLSLVIFSAIDISTTLRKFL